MSAIFECFKVFLGGKSAATIEHEARLGAIEALYIKIRRDIIRMEIREARRKNTLKKRKESALRVKPSRRIQRKLK